jgi:hypothetical protein
VREIQRNLAEFSEQLPKTCEREVRVRWVDLIRVGVRACVMLVWGRTNVPRKRVSRVYGLTYKQCKGQTSRDANVEEAARGSRGCSGVQGCVRGRRWQRQLREGLRGASYPWAMVGRW